MFKVYDKDQSGTISYREFESISSNFPFIECFSVLDQDKWVPLCVSVTVALSPKQ